jgi:hypothetical protein
LVISESEATQGMDLLFQIATKLAESNPAEAKALAVISAR